MREVGGFRAPVNTFRDKDAGKSGLGREKLPNEPISGLCGGHFTLCDGLFQRGKLRFDALIGGQTRQSPARTSS